MAMPMPLLVNCSGCQTALQLPPGAKSIRCALCQAVTQIAEPRGPPPPHSYHHQQSAHPAPAASPQHYSPAPPSSHGTKRAVVCGISYMYSRHELKGCLNDANCMKYLLINKFKFPEASILMLTGVDSMFGRIIVHQQVLGEEQMAGKPSPLVDVTITKLPQIPRLSQRSQRLEP